MRWFDSTQVFEPNCLRMIISDLRPAEEKTASCFEAYLGDQQLETRLTKKARTELCFIGVKAPLFEVVFPSNTVRQSVRGQCSVHDSRCRPRDVNYWRFLLRQGQTHISRSTRNCKKKTGHGLTPLQNTTKYAKWSNDRMPHKDESKYRTCVANLNGEGLKLAG